MENIKLEYKRHRISMMDFIETIERKIDEGLRLGLDLEVIEPFEACIDKKSMNVDSLIRYANLPIEVIMLHDSDGELILSTGSKVKSSYNFGPGREQVLRELSDMNLKGEGGKSEKYLQLSEILKNFDLADRVQLLRKYNPQPFIAHQHPSKKLMPSIEDLLYLLSAKSDSHLVITTEGVVFYNVTFETVDKLMESLRNFKIETQVEIDNFLQKFFIDNGIILGEYKYSDESFKTVLEFLKGESSFKDLGLIVSKKIQN